MSASNQYPPVVKIGLRFFTEAEIRELHQRGELNDSDLELCSQDFADQGATLCICSRDDDHPDPRCPSPFCRELCARLEQDGGWHL